MKKTLLIIAVAGLAMASCGKQRTCTCTTTNTDNAGVVTTGTPDINVYKKISSSDAKNQCVSESGTQSTTFGATTQTSSWTKTCTLS